MHKAYFIFTVLIIQGKKPSCSQDTYKDLKYLEKQNIIAYTGVNEMIKIISSWKT